MTTSARILEVAKNLTIPVLLTAAATVLFLPQAGTIHSLNLALLYSGIVTFTTGTMIALFIATFYSDQKKVKVLANHPQARTLFYLVLADLVLIVSAGALIGSSLPQSHSFEVFSACTMVIFAGDLVRWVVKLIALGV